jgi:hypothetical protein
MNTQHLDAELTDDELEEMERRCRTATAGPWVSYVAGRDTEAGCNYIETGTPGCVEIIGATIADQDFIASCREDVPRLINEVRRLRSDERRRYAIHAAPRAEVLTNTLLLEEIQQ